MESALLEAATKQGIWVIMFVFLFVYTIKNSEKREENYQALLTTLSQKYDLLLDVKENLKEIKKKLFSNTDGN